MSSAARRLKPRIAFLLEEWHHGGTEHYVAGLGCYLAENCDVDIEVILVREQRAPDLPGEYSWCRAIHVAGGPFPRRVGTILNLLKRRRYDVVHCHLYRSLLPAVVVSRLLKTPCIVATLHMPVRQWSFRHRLAWRLAVRHAHRIVGVSHDCLNSLDLPIDPPCSSVIPLPIPDLSTVSERMYVKIDQMHFTICGSGRLSQEKDWPTLIRAFAALLTEREKPMRLVLFGEGDQHAVLKSLADDLGIAANVVFFNYVERATLLKRLCHVDLFVLPSKFEGLGISAVEAMALGVPTITAAFPASMDYIRHGKTGHRFPCGDWQALKTMLAWHVDHPAESCAIGKAGQDFVRQRFSIARTFAQYLSVYRFSGR